MPPHSAVDVRTASDHVNHPRANDPVLLEEFQVEDAGYHKGLSRRQIQMIAIGGAIGTGLFLGAGGRLSAVGPGLLVAYAVCGFFAFLILRALGELVMHRPSSGSFVSYAREFFGEKAAFTVGWLYWLNWVTIAIVDTTAIALYMNFFKKYIPIMGAVPQWTWALFALALVVAMNLISVKVFGEMEFWFSLIKVVALVSFLLLGTYFVIFGSPIEGQTVGFSLISDNGSWFPNGMLPLLLVVQGVIFAYGSIELIGTASGETKDVAKVMPRAINSVVVRIVVFYIGSILLLSLLLPYTAYHANESPFVTFFGSIGVQGMDAIMNLVVLTAALSSLNAGMYSTGRIVHSLAAAGSAPRFTGRMNKAGVPFGGIALTGVVALIGVGLNAVVPEQAFEIVLNLASLCLIIAWATIIICQLRLWQWSRQGKLERPSFRLFGAPYSGLITLVFLLAVVVLIALDYPVGTYTVASFGLVIPFLIVGWLLVRKRVLELAAQRSRPGTSSVATAAVLTADRADAPADS
jgi:L-asparagine permease